MTQTATRSPRAGKQKAKQLAALNELRSAWVLRPGHGRKLFKVANCYELRVGDAFRYKGRWFYYGESEISEIIADKRHPLPPDAYNRARYYPPRF